MKFETGRMGDSLLLGDSGYTQTNYVMTPLANPGTPAKNLYNESQIRSRNTVERSYGVWKRRFPILSLGMRIELDRIKTVIVATAVLNNIYIAENDIPPDDSEVIPRILEYEEVPVEPANPVNVARKGIIIQYFQNLLNNAEF